MIKEITFPKDYQLSRIMFFETADITQMTNPKIVPLFGPNGIGKSTMIQGIIKGLEIASLRAKYKDDPDREYFYKQFDFDEKREACRLTLDDKPYKRLSYINSQQNFRTVNHSFNPFVLNARWDAKTLSEGQSIIYSIFTLFEMLKPGPNMSAIENGDTIVLIDELDSGLSVDNLDMCMRKLKYILRKREDIQIFFSFNNPRVLKFFPEVLSLYDGQPIVLHTADDMIKEMNKHKKMFNKTRKKSNGMPKVPQ